MKRAKLRPEHGTASARVFARGSGLCKAAVAVFLATALAAPKVAGAWIPDSCHLSDQIYDEEMPYPLEGMSFDSGKAHNLVLDEYRAAVAAGTLPVTVPYDPSELLLAADFVESRFFVHYGQDLRELFDLDMPQEDAEELVHQIFAETKIALIELFDASGAFDPGGELLPIRQVNGLALQGLLDNDCAPVELTEEFRRLHDDVQLGIIDEVGELRLALESRFSQGPWQGTQQAVSDTTVGLGLASSDYWLATGAPELPVVHGSDADTIGQSIGALVGGIVGGIIGAPSGPGIVVGIGAGVAIGGFLGGEIASAIWDEEGCDAPEQPGAGGSEGGSDDGSQSGTDSGGTGSGGSGGGGSGSDGGSGTGGSGTGGGSSGTGSG